MKRLLLLFALAIGNSYVGLAQPSNDPQGWTSAKWGMTAEQIKAAFPQATQIDGKLGLEGYVVSHQKFDILFSFDQTGGLNNVKLTDRKIIVKDDGTEVPMVQCPGCGTGIPSNNSRAAKEKAQIDLIVRAKVTADLNAEAAKHTKETLLDGLTQKYGTFTGHILDGSTEEFEWRFATTKITLMWFHPSYKDLDSTNLFYSKMRPSSGL